MICTSFFTLRRIGGFSLLIIIVGLLGACSHAAPLIKAQDSYRSGNLMVAEAELERLMARRSTGSMAVVTLLEAGSILQTLGRFEESNEALSRAIELMEEYEEKASVRVGQETKAAFTHQGLLAYEGKPYDRILAHALRAKNSMLMGAWEDVRPDIRAAHFAQQEAVRMNQRRIERAQEDIDKASEQEGDEANAYNLDEAQNDDRFSGSYEAHYGNLQNFQGYLNYVNPYVEWLSAAYYLSMAQGSGDYEQARFGFERVAGMIPDNPYILADSTDARSAESGGGCQPITWVVFATGTSPSRSQIRIDLPVFLIPGRVDYVGAAFPRLVFHDNHDRNLIVRTAGGEAINTAVVCDVDQIVAQDFRNELPVIIAKTLFSSALKAATAYAINQATRDNIWVNLSARVITAGYQISQNQADLRTWGTLPKQYQVARVQTPEDGLLFVGTQNGVERIVEVAPDEFNFVHVRSIHTNGDLIIHTVPFGGTTSPVEQIAMD